MAPVARAHAGLRISKAGATARYVTGTLDLEPHDSHEAGDSRGHRLRPWRNMHWSLSSGDTDGRPLSEHLEVLLELVEPRAEIIWALARDGFAMDWFCYVEIQGGQGGLSLDALLLARLGRLPIALDLDIYG